MGIEIERRFLVRSDDWRVAADDGVYYCQGYCPAGNGILRVRLAGNQGYITIKGRPRGYARAEYEYPIPEKDARELLELVCLGPRVEKHRYHVTCGGKLWEVDVFHGDNDGLVMAEIELRSETETFTRPSWAGTEVTADSRYCNAALAQNPFCQWRESGLIP